MLYCKKQFMYSATIAIGKGCSEYRGCQSGYCWAYCGVSLNSGEWCYTTKSGNSMDGNKVPCTTLEECSKCWRCAGACTL